VKKLTIEYIKDQFGKEGYKLLTTEYKNNKQKLDYICPRGHKHNITWNKWQRGERCSFCYGNVKLTIEFIKSEFERKDCKLLTKGYINSKQKLDYICPNGHKHSINWNSWNKGHKCSYCYGNVRLTTEFIRSEFEKEGCVFLTREYINDRQKLDYICPNSPRHSISWHNWHAGHRCPYCIVGISNEEVQVRNFIEFLGIKVSSNDRSQIFNPETGRGLELDIFMPTLNKAIEYNGEYWHRNKYMEDRDLLKQQLCRSKGIDLLIIWDKEWKTKNDICRGEIKKFIFVDFDD
jgi:hypothetical protein